MSNIKRTPESVDKNTEYYTCEICGYEDDDEAGFIDGICLGCARVNEIDY